MNDEKSIKKQTFLEGAAILTIATIAVKVLGFLFKVPLKAIIGNEGFSYFNTAYDVYNVLLMISTTGLPVAMSRMISEAQTLENYAQIRKIYKVSRYAFLTIGILGTLIMGVFCRQFSYFITRNDNSWPAILALAPCVLMICLVSSYRGFFQGQSNMTPTSVSQIYEAIIRFVLGLGAAWLLLRLTDGDRSFGAAGGILGVTIGCLVSMLYLRKQFTRTNQVLSQQGGEAKTGKSTMKELLAIAIPITLGAAGLQIINLLDTKTYMWRLTGALGWATQTANAAKGIYNYCQTIFALPCSLIAPITISAIPAITAALTANSRKAARRTEESAIRMMSLVTMPCAAGMFVLGGPIYQLLNFGKLEAGELEMAAPIMTYLGIAVIFNSTVLLFNAIMQAHGDVTTPVINMIIGGIVKVIVNFVLVGMASLNIVGASIGTVVCYATITVLDVIAMRKCVTTKPRLIYNTVRPFLAAALMGGGTWLAYRVCSSVISSQKIACLLAVAIAVVIYLVLIVALQCITYEDCMLLPKGEKIAKILRIREKT
jgi:stage V sporulation protein B